MKGPRPWRRLYLYVGSNGALIPSVPVPFPRSLDPTNYGLTGSTSNTAYATSVIAANANIQTTLTQGIALILGKAALTPVAERAVLTSLAKKFIKSAPKTSRRLLQSSGTATAVDLTNSTVVADLLAQSITAAQASGAITAAAAATAQSSVAVVAAAVSNVNAAVSRPNLLLRTGSFAQLFVTLR